MILDPLHEPAAPTERGMVALRGGVRIAFARWTPRCSGNGGGNGGGGGLLRKHAPQPQPPRPLGRCLLVSGAFASRQLWGGMPDLLAQRGFEVVAYDHRYIGASAPLPGSPAAAPGAELARQTSELLARDALALVNAVWGPAAAVHVYGISMGGMVAQELAALLAPRGRLVSLGLLATCRGPLGPVPAAAAPLLSARWIAPLVRLLFFTDKDRSQFAKLTILKLFTHAFLEARHPRSGARMRDIYQRLWSGDAPGVWDVAAGAPHFGVIVGHCLSDAKAAAIRGCGAPVLVQVADHDLLIPKEQQLALAADLGARAQRLPTGHMGQFEVRAAYEAALLEHLQASELLRAVALRTPAAAAPAAATPAAAAAAARKLAAREPAAAAAGVEAVITVGRASKGAKAKERRAAFMAAAGVAPAAASAPAAAALTAVWGVVEGAAAPLLRLFARAPAAPAPAAAAATPPAAAAAAPQAPAARGKLLQHKSQPLQQRQQPQQPAQQQQPSNSSSQRKLAAVSGPLAAPAVPGAPAAAPAQPAPRRESSLADGGAGAARGFVARQAAALKRKVAAAVSPKAPSGGGAAAAAAQPVAAAAAGSGKPRRLPFAKSDKPSAAAAIAGADDPGSPQARACAEIVLVGAGARAGGRRAAKPVLPAAPAAPAAGGPNPGAPAGRWA